MPCAFQYVPTSGNLSGVELEKQTERAINELCQEVEYSISIAEEAKGLAENAVSTANSAQDTAQQSVTIAQQALTEAAEAKRDAGTALAAADEAQRTADAAQESADKAQHTADTAQGSADAAHERADQAYDLAAQADTKAQNAQTSADNAQDTADTAITNAYAAQTTGDIALSSARNATYIATNALGLYLTDAGTIDANALLDAAKLYLTNPDIINLPVEPPAYINVCATDDGLSVTQFCWSASDGAVYTRTGVIDHSNPDEPVATWENWRASSGVTAADLVSDDANNGLSLGEDSKLFVNTYGFVKKTGDTMTGQLRMSGGQEAPSAASITLLGKSWLGKSCASQIAPEGITTPEVRCTAFGIGGDSKNFIGRIVAEASGNFDDGSTAINNGGATGITTRITSPIPQNRKAGEISAISTVSICTQLMSRGPLYLSSGSVDGAIVKNLAMDNVAPNIGMPGPLKSYTYDTSEFNPDPSHYNTHPVVMSGRKLHFIASATEYLDAVGSDPAKEAARAFHFDYVDGLYPGMDGDQNLGRSDRKWDEVHANTLHGMVDITPKTSTDVGKWQIIPDSYVLPSGGTWAYFAVYFRLDGNGITQDADIRRATGIVSGGSHVGMMTDGVALKCCGFCWRIA